MITLLSFADNRKIALLEFSVYFAAMLDVLDKCLIRNTDGGVKKFFDIDHSSCFLVSFNVIAVICFTNFAINKASHIKMKQPLKIQQIPYITNSSQLEIG